MVAATMQESALLIVVAVGLGHVELAQGGSQGLVMTSCHLAYFGTSSSIQACLHASLFLEPVRWRLASEISLIAN